MEISFNQHNDIMIDGRPSYQLSDATILKAYEEEKDPVIKAMLAELVAGRLKHFTPRSDETKDEAVGRVLEDYVNGHIVSKKDVADRMARSHRYLQQELFSLFTYYIKKLSDAYENGRYDDRNKWACEKAKKIVDNCFEVGYNGILF